MDGQRPRVMIVAEVAEYLPMPKASVYELARQGKIPVQKKNGLRKL